MTTNPYSSPSDAGPSKIEVPRMLYWFSMAVVWLGGLLWLIVVGSLTTDLVNGYGSNPRLQVIVLISFTIGLVAICIPQFLSVFRRSARFAQIVCWVSIAGVVIGLATAVIYPIVEYKLDFSPPGMEIIGAVSYSVVAALFWLNWRLHRDWRSVLAPNDKADGG